jgi:hypothetical protein
MPEYVLHKSEYYVRKFAKDSKKALESDDKSLRLIECLDRFEKLFLEAGFSELKGKYKKSIPNHSNNNYNKIIRLVNDNQIHHYHIGFPKYEGYGSNLTSSYVVFYSKYSKFEIELLGYGPHNPPQRPMN